MPWSTRSTRSSRPTTGACWLLAAVFGVGLLLTACGGEETALPPGEEHGPDGTNSEQNGGPDERTNNENTDNENTENQSSENQNSENESALLDIVANAEGSGADPDNRTGSPPAVPSTFCAPPSDSFNILVMQPATFAGTSRAAVACLGHGDLWQVTVTDPNGNVRDRSWAQNFYRLELALTDPAGRYEATATRRQGGTIRGDFTVDPIDTLTMDIEGAGPNRRLTLVGYGNESTVDLVAYKDTGVIRPLYIELAYYGHAGTVPLDPSGATQHDVTSEETELCLYVSVTDEARFPGAGRACFDDTATGGNVGGTVGDAVAGQTPLEQSLTEGLGRADRSIIAPMVASLGNGMSVAIATMLDDAGDAAGAVVFEGKSGSELHDRLEAISVIDVDEDPDFAAAFDRLCDVAADRYAVLGDPCLRPIEPPEITFPDLVVVEDTLPALWDVVGQAAITDCLPYDRDNLHMVDEGVDGWLLTDGRSRLAVLDSKADADIALAVARYHDRQCFVGRDNTRADRSAFVADFWLGGKPGGPTLNGEDCLGYDPTTLRIEDLGGKGWRLTDGRSSMLVLDTELDARKAMNTAAGFTQHCFAGRSNQRAERSSYVFEYWK